MDKGSVLIVEDESIVALDLETTLTDLGFTTVGIADEADSALDLAGGKLPDVTLMDIHLKGSRDGIEIAHDLYNRFKIPTVFLTAHSDREILDRALDVSPYGYLLKPYRKEELAITLESTIKRSGVDKAIRISMRLIKTAIENMVEGIIIADSKGVISYVNSHAISMLRLEQEKIIGTTIDSILVLQSKTADGDTVNFGKQDCGRAKPLDRNNGCLTFVSSPILENDIHMGTVFTISYGDADSELDCDCNTVDNSEGIEICASCNCIRDEGRWNDLDSYLNEVLNRGINRTLCENCVPKFFPDQSGLQAIFTKHDPEE